MIEDTNGRAAKRHERYIFVHAVDYERAKELLGRHGIWYRQGELSPAEFGVLKILATGATNDEIARQLAISTKTVKSHVASVLSKIGARNRTEAALHALQYGIAELAPADDGMGAL